MNPVGYVFLVGGAILSFFVLSVTAGNGQGSVVAGAAAFALPCLVFAVSWMAFAAEAKKAREALNRIWDVR